ncbi:hypothetical protein RSAG8_10973, partial [Rhizoctonia solani AG-8 WAC10335]
MTFLRYRILPSAYLVLSSPPAHSAATLFTYTSFTKTDTFRHFRESEGWLLIGAMAPHKSGQFWSSPSF